MTNDDENPKYMFQTTNTSLLSKIVSGELDPVDLARKEMANRGLNADGDWVGFDNAAKNFWRSMDHLY